MRLKNSSLPLIIVLLSACGGGGADSPSSLATPSSAVSASVPAQSTSASSPSSSATTTQVPVNMITARNLTEAQALSLLTEDAKKKLESEYLTRIFKNESNDFLISFVNKVPVDLDVTQKMVKYAELKKSVLASFQTGELVVLQEYDALPMSYFRANDRTSLLNLLNHPQVSGIYENTPHNLTQLPSH